MLALCCEDYHRCGHSGDFGWSVLRHLCCALQKPQRCGPSVAGALGRCVDSVDEMVQGPSRTSCVYNIRRYNVHNIIECNII